MRPMAAEKAIELSAELPPGEMVIATDRRALSQILLNLLTNACKFTEQGAVRIGVERIGPEGRSIAFRVTDTGIGIRDEDRRGFSSRSFSSSGAAGAIRSAPGWGCTSASGSPSCSPAGSTSRASSAAAAGSP